MKDNTPNYEGFYEHVKEYDEISIPYGFRDLIRIAKLYNCEIPTLVDGKLVFKTI